MMYNEEEHMERIDAKHQQAVDMEEDAKRINEGVDELIATNVDLLEVLELVMTDITLYSPDWDETKVGGLATIMLEIYTIRQIEEAIQKAKQ